MHRRIHTPAKSKGRGFRMREISIVFQGIEDPRGSNATRHDLHEMLMIDLLSTLSGGEGCVDMEVFGCMKEPFCADSWS